MTVGFSIRILLHGSFLILAICSVWPDRSGLIIPTIQLLKFLIIELAVF